MSNHQHSRLGQILINKNLITSQQLDAAIQLQLTSNKRLGEILIERGLVTEKQLHKALRKQTNLRLVTTIEYFIQPAQAAQFHAVMQDSRRARLRAGALSWELQHDIEDPSRYVERIVDESWIEHLRRFERITASDVALRDRRFAFHIGEGPPQVARYVVEGD